ncbi:hypothetical protein M0811_14653 [Anaeramoeba ignava]|uniref:Uncharacterized protein n=1 Tax=Anaeramoeba ignava TaxID=1746090 RepID=A0A9Q0LXC8_ANAIG|nr:hypothetical protein M0811_14653 [Anaeramoeba ignava]
MKTNKQYFYKLKGKFATLLQQKQNIIRVQSTNPRFKNRTIISLSNKQINDQLSEELNNRSIHEYTSSTDNNITDGFDSNNPNDSNLTGNEDRAIGFDDSNLLNNTIDRNLNSSPLSIHENEHLKEFTVFDNPNSDSSKTFKNDNQVLAIRIPSFQEIQENGISQIKPK